jgi:ATP-dependent Clp protease protease subunit
VRQQLVAVDIEIRANGILRYRRVREEIIARLAGQPLERVSHDTDRDFILTAEAAMACGLVVDVIRSPKHAEPVTTGSVS